MPSPDLEVDLQRLDRDGFLLIRNALDEANREAVARLSLRSVPAGRLRRHQQRR